MATDKPLSLMWYATQQQEKKCLISYKSFISIKILKPCMAIQEFIISIP
jgi:hypothetical protein